MDQELYSLILDDIEDRSQWADRQATWYRMRRHGKGRRRFFWPGGANLHYPLADTLIEMMKPAYLAQLFATDRLVDMVIKDPQKTEVATDCAYWFDYKVKHFSNIEDSVPVLADHMMMYSHGLLKTTWDFKCECLRFDPIMPLYVIVPSNCGPLEECERVVHVRHLTPWQYKYGQDSEKYNQDEDFVRRIKGRHDYAKDERYFQTKRHAEGISYSNDSSLIIIWEVYEKTKSGYEVHTISPQLKDEEVMKSHGLVYKNGYNNKPELPIVDFVLEKVDVDYYEQRGACEILDPFQSSIEYMWNNKHDTMTLYNNPMLTSDREINNIINIKCRPGQILPGGLRAINMGPPPVSYDQEMATTRLIAERRLAVPDFGQGGQPFQNKSNQPKTATEVNNITTQAGSVSDMRWRLWRRALNKVYCQAWGLLKQYDYDLWFLREGTMKQLPEDVRDEIVSIKPNGTSDSWSIHIRLARANQRLQMYRGDPHIKQDELLKSCLELDEPGLVARLLVDPDSVKQTQATRQMMEMPSLDSGMPIEPNPDDDDEIHAGVTFQYILRNIQVQKKPEDPAGPIMLRKHWEAHVMRLSEKNPKAANALKKQMDQLSKAVAEQQGGNGQPQLGPPAQGPPQMQPNGAPAQY